MRRGDAFYVTDDRGIAPFEEVLAAWPRATWLDTSTALGITAPTRLPFEQILLSPGVPLSHPLLVVAAAHGIPILSEIEFAARLSRAPLIMITGTNGKSTTTALVAHFLSAAGYKTKACGNFGIPLVEVLADGTAYDALVVEASSFQGETSPTFKPRYAALLNLTPDHLDRYAGMEDYFEAKKRLVRNQDPGDVLVYNAEVPAFIRYARESRAEILPFSSAKRLDHGAFLRGEEAVIRLAGGEETVSLARNPLVGLHHLENILAAVLIARRFGVPAAVMESALASFQGLPHRLEWVGEREGVRFYDDSKATNVGALEMSLASFDEKVILIAGGRDKDSDFRPLAPLIRAKVHAALLIGEAAEKIAAAWRDTGEVVFCKTLDKAVVEGFKRARLLRCPVLLAPACASFDQFRDYKDRGERFRAAVNALC